MKTAQKNEENRQLLEAVINYLGQNGVEAHLTVIYEGGKRTLVIVLPGVEPKEVLELFPHLNPLSSRVLRDPKGRGEKTRASTSSATE